ncbi:hypothetical protein FD723_00150 [Nostoc sp. C052]|uniref:hypothetical protein n=1 Tax=Nostoc sp. C052 TaxID=2576902 RepID=UPI0015C39446|nr:hypothetical protein [Nostoc sp. C052]QLE39077.1 hypothetical protein FD723_00150 [Nostoc sp. C052]
MKHELFFYDFEIKYYQWRLKEAQKEYESGFERLSQMNSYFVRLTLEAIQALSPKEQSRILPILIRISERQLLEFIGDNITDEEKEILKRFDIVKKNQNLRKKLHEEEKIFKKYPKNKLKKIIKNALIEILQPTFYSDICFDTQIDRNWKVTTFVDIADGYSYYYSHSIVLLDEQKAETRIGSFTINLPAWLGLYPSGWLFMSDEDVYQSANAIAALCKYFIEAFTEWNRIDL